MATVIASSLLDLTNQSPAQERRQSVSPAPLHVVTLGRFEVWQGSRPLDPRPLRRRRADELLALLLVSPRHVLAVEQVTDALSPDRGHVFSPRYLQPGQALEPGLPE